MSLSEHFKEELAAIKAAKLTFFIGFIVLAAVIAYGEYSFVFKELLSGKDGIIKDKDVIIKDKSDTIENLRRQLSESQKTGRTSVSSPSPAANPRKQSAPTRIHQEAIDSSCSNVAAGRDVTLNCPPSENTNERKK